MNVGAIPCDNYITKYLSDELVQARIDSINEELYNKADLYLCPDTQSFLLSRIGDLANTKYDLQFEVIFSQTVQDQYVEDGADWAATKDTLE